MTRELMAIERVTGLEGLDLIKKRVADARDLIISQKKARIIVHMGTCGVASGASSVRDNLLKLLQDKGERREDFDIWHTGCVGFCSQEPIVTVELPGQDPVRYRQVDEEKLGKIFDGHIRCGEIQKDYVLHEDEDPYFKKQCFVVLRNRGIINPDLIEHYIYRDGYRALDKAVKQMKPAGIVEEVTQSGLRGRGGAGFPTGTKWKFAMLAPGDVKFVLCNADEGDPGAYMDRSVLESDPHSVLEGMAIAGKAIGAHQGYIYCRAEYPLAVDTIVRAIAQAREYGFLGKNILGTGFDFDVDLYVGAGAFVCGEETALMASIEGRRGMPRVRPPFPAHQGLWKSPTILNNVETLSNIPQIILKGGAWYASMGYEKSRGTKVFALTGAVKNIGLVEVPMGTTLRDIIFEIGQGIKGKRKFKAVQLGGPSGGCIPEEKIDTPTDYEAISQVGAIMGSGGMIVMDNTTCMVDMARFFMEFCQDESCGKCTPCREGTKQMLKVLERITRGEGKEGDIEFLEELAMIIKNSSLCGLGQTAPNPILSTIRYFRKEYEAHIYDRQCPTHACVPLVHFEVIPDTCTRCGLCFRACPSGAVIWEKKQIAQIDKAKCIKCMSCIGACPFDAIE
jgi:NADH-quinone oxidoreductase subunit F/NAD(P)H dehydrogenase (quinone)/NADP-reducing hydrogenase subunit HndC